MERSIDLWNAQIDGTEHMAERTGCPMITESMVVCIRDC